MRERKQTRPRRHGREDRVGVRLHDDDAGAARMKRAQQAEVLGVRRHDLVLRRKLEPGEDDVAAVGGRARQRDLLDLDADEAGERAAHLEAQREHPLEVRRAEAAVLELGALLALHGVECRPSQRPERAGIEIGLPLEHRKERPRLVEGHPTFVSTGE